MQVHIRVGMEGNEKHWSRLLLLVSLEKIRQCGQIIRKFEEFFISRRSHEIMDFLRLLWVILIIGHFISCVWIITAQIERSLGSEITWMDSQRTSSTSQLSLSANWELQYIEAFYFSMVTMVTVGYGDVLPVTAAEKTICVVLMLVSCGIFAYSMNTIGNILENFNSEEVQIFRQMNIISTYMSNKNVG